MRRAVVIGSGWGAHGARALSRHPEVSLEAIVARGSDRSRALADELDVPIWPEASGPLELAVVAVGERVHFDLVAPLLERGVAVLVAHPVCLGAEEVERLDAVAARAGSVVRTDYTFRARPELRCLRPTGERGALLRLAIEAPGRWLPIALDVAVEVAGPVRVVHAHGAYPPALAERARRAPHVFVPTVTLSHESGTVSTIVPVPHAPPAEPVRVCVSYERGRLTASLPRGGAGWLALRAAGQIDERALVERSAEPRDASVHARGMQALVERFVDTLDAGAPDLATLEEEAHLRRVWAATWRARGHREGVDVASVSAPSAAT